MIIAQNDLTMDWLNVQNVRMAMLYKVTSVYRVMIQTD